MCIEIDSRCVILNIMQANETVELRQLVEFAVEMKKRDNEVYVDISDASVLTIIEEYGEVFTLTGNTITWTECARGGRFKEREFLDKTVNRDFDPGVRDHLHECAKMMA